MNSIVKPMELKDLESVEHLCQELGYPTSKALIRERFELLGKQPRHGLFVVHDSKVEGFIHLEVVLDLIEEQKVEIKALVVNENQRGKGLGKLLIEKSREWAKSHGVSIIYLSCNILRDKAHAFYLREGFKKTKNSHFFELEI